MGIQKATTSSNPGDLQPVPSVKTKEGDKLQASLQKDMSANKPAMDYTQDPYSTLENRAGTIYNKGTNAGFATNADLANYLGVKPEEIDWSRIMPLKSPEAISSPEEANAFINQGQASAVSDQPVVRNTPATIQSTVETMNKTMADQGITKPASFSNETAYKNLIADPAYKTEDLQNELNNLNDKEEQLKTGLNELNESEDASDAARFVIERRQNQNSQLVQRELDSLELKKSSLTRQINTRVSAINMLMNFKQLDYQNASDEYNKSYANALSMLSYVNELNKTQYEQEKDIRDEKHQLENEKYQRDQDEKTAARANLQVVYNGIQESGKSIDELSGTEKLMITQLETQAGLPVGFYKSFEKLNPGGTIVTTSTFTDANNNKVVSVIRRDDKTGALSTSNMIVGKEKAPSSGGSSSSTPSSYKEWLLAGGEKSGYSYADWIKGKAGDKKFDRDGAYAEFGNRLDSLKGSDKHVSDPDWNSMRDQWKNAGGNVQDFDTKFKNYINPEYEDLYNNSLS